MLNLEFSVSMIVLLHPQQLCLIEQQTSSLAWLLQQSAAFFLKGNLETVAKENTDLRAHVGQLMAQLDAKVLTAAVGELALRWGDK